MRHRPLERHRLRGVAALAGAAALVGAAALAARAAGVVVGGLGARGGGGVLLQHAPVAEAEAAGGAAELEKQSD